MTTTEEGWHLLPDQSKLYTKSWKPEGKPKATLVLIHGFSDHCNRYNDFLTALSKSGILVHSFDQRGWGRSVLEPSHKGLTGKTPQVLADITSFIESKLPPPAPLFVMGHSMGGGECLQYISKCPDSVRSQVRGFIAEAPLIRVHESTQPSRFTVIAGRLAEKVLPRMTMVNKLDPQWQSHDPVANQDWTDDPLCHDTGTLEGLANMLDRSEELDKYRLPIKDYDGLSILIAHGTDDRCTSPDASKQYFEKLQVKDKTLKLYDGAYHCIHLEPDGVKEKFAADISEWILSRAEAVSSQIGSVEAHSKL